NVRGQLLTALDPRQRLGLPERPPSQLPVNLVVHAGDEAVSLLVDDIGDMIETDERLFERTPSTLTGAAGDVICGAYKLSDELLLLLDSEKVTALDQSCTGPKGGAAGTGNQQGHELAMRNR
ncbi:MAG TPA: chemotaxis protein CheW, partial [Terriglobales bacterium]|nr:chemotaxis protein CheW [Terriglobales bacterium]